MTRLRSLIKEVLSQPKKKDCGCGCNDCGGKAPILTEGKFKSLISEGLQYHMDKKISLFESVYRIGSEKHLELIREARALWIRGIIEVSDDDKGLLETHLGHFGLYEGVEVPLDLPMVNEKEGVPHYTKDGKEWKGKVHKMPNGKLMTQNPHNEDSEELFHKEDLKENNLLRQTNLSSEEYQKAKKLKGFNADDYTFSSDNNLYVKKSSLDEAMVDYDFSKEELIRVIKQLKRGASTEVGMIKAFEKALGRELTDDEIRGFKLKEDDIDESLNPEVSRSLDKFIRAMADRYDYTMQDAVYAIMAALKQRNYDGLGEASMTGTGASFNAGSGEGYMSPNAFGDDKKKKMKTYKSIGYKKI